MMPVWMIVLIGWAVFLLVVYALAWYDYAYYYHDLKGKWKRMLDAFTEE